MIDPNLPGAEIIEKGLADLAKGLVTIESCLVSMAPNLLEEVGINFPDRPIDEPELTMFRLIESRSGDAAHSQYNALRRRLVSFVKSARLAARGDSRESINPQ